KFFNIIHDFLFSFLPLFYEFFKCIFNHTNKHTHTHSHSIASPTTTLADNDGDSTTAIKSKASDSNDDGVGTGEGSASGSRQRRSLTSARAKENKEHDDDRVARSVESKSSNGNNHSNNDLAKEPQTMEELLRRHSRRIQRDIASSPSTSMHDSFIEFFAPNHIVKSGKQDKEIRKRTGLLRALPLGGDEWVYSQYLL
ncbi:hypothetical protein DOY81_011795, partial [Sarcophaga bullata]